MWSPARQSFMYLAAASIGSGHTLLSFWLLFSIAEIRQKLHSTIIKNRRMFTAIIILGTLITLALLNRNFAFIKSPFIEQLLEFLLLVVIGQHALAQTKGLSLLYNKNLMQKIKNELEMMKIRKLELIERQLFFIFICLWILTLAARDFHFDSLVYPLSFLIWVPAFLIIFVSTRYPFFNQMNKSLFLIRLFIYPMAIQTPIATFFIFFLHGFEYQQIVFSIFSKNKNEKLFVAVLLITTFIIFPFMNLANDSLLQNNGLFLGLFLVAQFINHSHYVCDALMFRRKTSIDLFRLAPGN
jgi:hypothetical protein